MIWDDSARGPGHEKFGTRLANQGYVISQNIAAACKTEDTEVG